MRSRSIRLAIVALVMAAMLSMTVPATAEASTFDRAERIASRVEAVIQQGIQMVSTMWTNVADFVATSTATICGDG